MSTRTSSRTAVVAHRGGALLWPENSMTAFRGALAAGFDMIEFDVHVTRDGELAVIHDPTVDRTTTGTGAIHDLTLKEAARFPILETSGESIPRLADVLALYQASPAKLIVEVKERADGLSYPDLPEKLLSELSRFGMLDRSRISAFHWPSLERLRGLSPTVRLVGVLGGKRPLDRASLGCKIDRLVELGVADVGLEWTMIDREAVRTAHEAGLEIGAWTANQADEHRHLSALGIDWLITDRPDIAREAISTAGR